MVSASEFEHGTQVASVLEQWLPMAFNLTKGLNLFSSTEASLSLTGLVDDVALAGCSKHGCCSRNGVFFYFKELGLGEHKEVCIAGGHRRLKVYFKSHYDYASPLSRMVMVGYNSNFFFNAHMFLF